MKNFDPQLRCEHLGRYIVRHGATVRETAAHFGISKSTVHKDVTTDLAERNGHLFSEVREILQKNKMERHLRGGEATRQKYKNEAVKKRRERGDA